MTLSVVLLSASIIVVLVYCGSGLRAHTLLLLGGPKEFVLLDIFLYFFFWMS